MIFAPAKFETAMSNGLGGDALFTRNVTENRTHVRMHGRTDGRRTDFGTKLINPFLIKKKAGIAIVDSA